MSLERGLEIERTDDAIVFRLIIQNDGEKPETLRFPDACRADFFVSQDDKELWRWSDGRLFARAQVEEQLPPGEELTFRGTWDEPPEGSFEVTAELQTTDEPLAVSDSFTV